MPPRRVKDDRDLGDIHAAGKGFIYNDNWSEIHKATCPSIKTMKVFSGTDEEYGEYKNPGMKYFDLSKDDLLTWFETWWREDDRPEGVPRFCTICGA